MFTDSFWPDNPSIFETAYNSSPTVREGTFWDGITEARPSGAVDKVLNPVAQDAGLQYRGRPVRMESGIGSFDPL